MADITKNKEKKSPIFSITIEIAQEKHHLHIFKYDTPSQIAYRFCIQNNWDLACVTPVSMKIQEVFEEYLLNPQLQPKLRRKLEQIMPNDSNQQQYSSKELIQIEEDLKVQKQRIQQMKKLQREQLDNTLTSANDHIQNSATETAQKQLIDNPLKLSTDKTQNSSIDKTQTKTVDKTQMKAVDNSSNTVTDNTSKTTEENRHNIQQFQTNNETMQQPIQSQERNLMQQQLPLGLTQKVTINNQKQNNNDSITNITKEIYNSEDRTKNMIDNKTNQNNNSIHFKTNSILSQQANSGNLNEQFSQQGVQNNNSKLENIGTSSSSTLAGNSTNSAQRKYFNCNHISNIVQQKVIKKLEDQRQTTDKKKKQRSLSLDNNNNSSYNNTQSYSSIRQISKILTEQPNSLKNQQQNNIFRNSNSKERLQQQQQLLLQQLSSNSCERIKIQQSILQGREIFKREQEELNNHQFIGREEPYQSQSLGRNNAHQQSNNKQRKHQTSASGSQSPTGLSSHTVYDRGVYFLGQKKSKIEQFKQSRQDRIMSSCTFAPKTNQKVNDLLLQYRDKTIDPYDQLYQNSKVIEIKKAIIKNKLLSEEGKEFSFKPALNPISKLIMKTKRQSSISDNASSFEAHKQTKISQIQQEMLKECTFHPQISKLSQKISQSHNPNLNVYDRLYTSTKKNQVQRNNNMNDCNYYQNQQSNDQQSYNGYDNSNQYNNNYGDSELLSQFQNNGNPSFVNNGNQIQQNNLQYQHNGNPINQNNCNFINQGHTGIINQNITNQIAQNPSMINQSNGNLINQNFNLINQNSMINQNNGSVVNQNKNVFTNQNYNESLNSHQSSHYHPQKFIGEDSMNVFGNNYYNPSSSANQHYSFSQDKHQNSSQQFVNGQNELLSSDSFNNSEQIQPLNSCLPTQLNNQVPHNHQNNIFSQNNSNYNSIPNQNNMPNFTSIPIQNNIPNQNNTNNSNNLSLLNQSDLIVSSSQMNGSMNFNKEELTNQSLDNCYYQVNLTTPNINGVNTCIKSGNRVNANNRLVQNEIQTQKVSDNKKQLNSSMNSQGKKGACSSSINTMQSSFCSTKHIDKSKEKLNKENKDRFNNKDKSYKQRRENNFSPNKNSVALMEKKKKQRFEEIFTLMDSDKDGLISAQNISIQDLPDEILVIIAPLLYELEDMDAELTLVEFVDAFEKLFKQLTLIDRNKLLLFDTYQKWEQEKNYLHTKDLNFQPSINPQSEIIAHNSRQRGSENLYDLYKERDRISEEKLMQKRREKENQINEQCTFHPNILQNNQQQTKQSKESTQQNTCQSSFQEIGMKNSKIV